MSDLDQQLKDLLLKPEPTGVEGLSEDAQRIYRRQVRGSLYSGTRLAIPIAIKLLGDSIINAYIARWLHEAPPNTRLYWQLPLEFAAWFLQQTDFEHPALPELIHWETIEVDVINAPNPDPIELLHPKPSDALSPVLDPSTRLCIYRYPVHRMTRSTEAWPTPLEAPTFLLAYRKEEVMYWKIISPQTAQLLAKASEGAQLSACYEFLEQLYGQIDRASIDHELSTLVHKGALRGFVAL